MPGLTGFFDSAQANDRPDEIVNTALETVRRHFRMEVAYLSEFVGETIVFRAVNAPGFEALVKPGDTMAIDQVYCRHILEGRLPTLIADTHDFQLARDLPITAVVPIRSHVSLPIRREDGEVFGMFCCLARDPKPDLTPRDLEVMQLFADLTSRQVNRVLRDRQATADKEARVRAALEQEQFHIVFQPICALDTAVPAGFEALCRFESEPYRSPDIWFAEAAALGLGPDLEIAVIRRALAAMDSLPPDTYMSINASPETVISGRLAAVLADAPVHRVVIEVTEHAVVPDHCRLQAELFRLRVMGATLAVDDAGAGYSGLQHIVRLQPDIIKLDMSLTRGIDRDPIRRSLAAAMMSFSRESGSVLVAEGIETADELATLRQIGIGTGQGYLLGRPAAMARPMGQVRVAAPR